MRLSILPLVLVIATAQQARAQDGVSQVPFEPRTGEVPDPTTEQLIEAITFDQSAPTQFVGDPITEIAPPDGVTITEDDELRLPEGGTSRPGQRDPGARYQPFQATSGYLIRGLRLWVDTGVGYDDNSRLEDVDERDSTVTWFDFGGSWGDDLSYGDGSLIFYGVNLGGALFSFGSGNARDEDISIDPHLNPYVGIRGQKTLIRLDAFYDLFNGNDYFYDQNNRESQIAEGQTTSFRLSGTRLFDHSSLEAVVDYTMEEYDADTFLNDRTSWIADIGYYYNPPRAPRTSVGGGLRFGQYFTDRNPDMAFYEPSLRARYKLSLKTSLDARVGYMFRHYEGDLAGPDGGDLTFGVGADYRATDRHTFRVEGYRDYQPSLVSSGENYEATGVQVSWNYRMPWWRLYFTATAAYEFADYESTTILPGSGRADDYYWLNADLSRPLDIISWIDSSISVFYNYRDNNSTIDPNDFTQNFYGIRLRGTF